MAEKFLAKTFAGLESLLKDELLELGAENCQVLNRAVKFEGPISLMYKCNYFCRTALRIFWQISEFKFQNNNQFYDEIYRIPSERFLKSDGTLAVSATIHESIFNTPLFASVLAKDAICDRFREKYNERPSVDKENPDVQFHLHIFGNQAIVYLDSSGESLHKRGYKEVNHPASINEVLASAMIQLSGWNQKCDFIDFMCGGGTLLVEAAMLALNIPAGFYRRDFGFFSWQTFDRRLWNDIKKAARIKDDVNIDFYGSDISGRFVDIARQNIENANLQDFIRLRKMDLATTKPKRTPAFVISNPPYGERLQVEDLNALYQSIGDTLKRNYTGCTAAIISSDKEAMKNIGLHPAKKFTLFNGALECKYHIFNLWKEKPLNK
ncbi:MAG: class I SAM-dependent RNA methyltransferase [Bacteroidales bacterium]|nr:class I SAM-dependent RNA methyltransferase [Bacteroidales bacterium]